MKILVVVDMQNDFIDGALGTKEAEGIVSAVKAKIEEYDPGSVYVTMDTHDEKYLGTKEGEDLPVEHCIKGTEGWELSPVLRDALKSAKIYEKPSFGSIRLAEDIKKLADKEGLEGGKGMEIELVGLCTDICVVSNALLLKAFLPEADIKVDPSCCAGVTPDAHEAALKTMASCHIKTC